MKRWLLIALMLIVFPVIQVAAQDEPTPTPEPEIPIVVEDGGTVIVENDEETVPTNVVYILLLVVGGLGLTGFVAYAYSQGKTSEMLWKSFPQPVQTGGRIALEYALQEALRTPETMDEELLERLAAALGYTVTHLEDGRVILAPKLIAPAPPIP